MTVIVQSRFSLCFASNTDPLYIKLQEKKKLTLHD